MKNIKKILPAIALAGAGIIVAAGAGDASAYDYSQQLGYNNGTYTAAKDPSDVSICYTINNVVVPIAATYTFAIASNDLDLSEVTAVASSSDYSYSSSSISNGSFTINFTSSDTVTGGVQQKCAHLNFASALPSDSAFTNYAVTVGVPSASPSTAPLDTTSGKAITFGYQLSNDASGYPQTNATGTYLSEYWTKSAPSYTASATVNYGHVTVEKKVKGHGANPDQAFSFTANVVKKYNAVPGVNQTYDYYIFIDGQSPIGCTYSNDCSFSLKHGQKAYVGCENATCANDGHLIRDAVTYTITEASTTGYTTFLDGLAVSTNTTGSKELDAALKEHVFVNQNTNTIAGRFFNILPFIVLAALATVGVVTLRKANKKNEA